MEVVLFLGSICLVWGQVGCVRSILIFWDGMVLVDLWYVMVIVFHLVGRD